MAVPRAVARDWGRRKPALTGNGQPGGVAGGGNHDRHRERPDRTAQTHGRARIIDVSKKIQEINKENEFLRSETSELQRRLAPKASRVPWGFCKMSLKRCVGVLAAPASIVA